MKSYRVAAAAVIGAVGISLLAATPALADGPVVQEIGRAHV